MTEKDPRQLEFEFMELTEQEKQELRKEQLEATQSEEQKNQELLLTYGELFHSLLQSRRFTDLFKVYFTLTKVVDEETKTVTFSVVENPPEIVAKKMMEMQQEEGKKIEVVSGSAAKHILAQTKKKLRKRK